MIADPRFFKRSGPRSLALIAETARGFAPDVELQLTGVAPLQAAAPSEVSFLDNRRYASALEKTLAGAVIVHPDMLQRVPAGTVPIVTGAPQIAAGG
jgi:UDP-3-O-[3-hydroxymyristoyl] glucosamine N-acyltransferase